MAAGTIEATIEHYVQALRSDGLLVDFVILMGSHATGAVHEWSDIDLVVVSTAFDAAEHWDDIELLWRTAARVDSRIEPIPCGLKQWEQGEGGMIVDEARRHGIRIQI